MNKRLSLLGSALILVVCGCQDAGSPALSVSLEEMPSPASSPSGEPFLSSSEDGVYLSWLEEVAPTMYESVSYTHLTLPTKA